MYALIIVENSCNACVFWKTILTNILELFQATCSIIDELRDHFIIGRTEDINQDETQKQKMF